MIKKTNNIIHFLINRLKQYSPLILYLFLTHSNCFSHPNYTYFFTDQTDTIDHTFLTKLTNIAADYDKTGFQIGGIFTFDHTKTALEKATEYGNTKQLGSKEKNNGIAFALILKEGISIDQQKPPIAVAIGKGLEGILNDAKIGRMLDKTYVKYRKNNEWQKGVIEFLNLLHNYLQNPQAQEFADINKKLPPPPEWLVILLASIIICIILLSISHNNGSGPKGPSGSNRGFYSNRSFGSGGGFSGGRGGGGGGFGGGGASR